jgi:hypothetical protein
MFSAYRSESLVKICSLLGQETIFSLSVRQTVSLKVDLSCNSMFISLNKRFLAITYLMKNTNFITLKKLANIYFQNRFGLF